MPNIADLHAATTVDVPEAELHDAVVLDDATEEGQEIRCVVESIDDQLSTDPCEWSPVSGALGTYYPKKGDRAVVSYHPDGPSVIVWWQPSTSTPDHEASAGKEGPAGKDGANGTNGATWYSGSGTPSSGTGVDGDFYLRTSNSEVYKKEAGSWVELVSIKGATGATGGTGATGATGPAGPTSGGLILVRVATTGALATNTAPTTKTLEASANGALASQDGVALAVGDRLLVKNEGTGSKNGVYEVTSLGSGSSKWKLTRISSMDESSEVVGGMQFNVLQGTQFGGVTFKLLTTGMITLGTTVLTFGYASEWVAPTLLNSWANFEAAGTNETAAYRKGPDGRVTIRGLLKHEGSITALATSAIFVLPEGFRPSKALRVGCVYVNGALLLAHLIVTTGGEVVFMPNATGAVSYTPLALSFYAD